MVGSPIVKNEVLGKLTNTYNSTFDSLNQLVNNPTWRNCLMQQRRGTYLVTGSLKVHFAFLRQADAATDILEETLTGSDIETVIIRLHTGEEVELDCDSIEYLINAINKAKDIA